MKDMQAHLEKLQVQIAECEMIRDLATDPAKRELFGRLADHFRVLASEIEKTITAMPSPDTFSNTFIGRETQEPFPKEDE